MITIVSHRPDVRQGNSEELLVTLSIDKVMRRNWQRKLMMSQLSIDLYTLPAALRCTYRCFGLQNGGYKKLFHLPLSMQTCVKPGTHIKKECTTLNTARKPTFHQKYT